MKVFFALSLLVALACIVYENRKNPEVLMRAFVVLSLLGLIVYALYAGHRDASKRPTPKCTYADIEREVLACTEECVTQPESTWETCGGRCAATSAAHYRACR